MIDAENQTLPLDEEARRRTLSQMIDLFVKPEIERRRASGKVEGPFGLFGLRCLRMDTRGPRTLTPSSAGCGGRRLRAAPVREIVTQNAETKRDEVGHNVGIR